MTTRRTHGVSIKRACAALAAAGLAGVALTACSPNEHPTSEKGTTPPVITGNQAIPGDLVNADDIPADHNNPVGTVTLLDNDGHTVGAASFVKTAGGTQVNLRLNANHSEERKAIPAGQHRVEVRNSKECFTGGTPAAVIANGTLPTVTVDSHGAGSTRATVAVDIAALNDKILVISDTASDPQAVACGLIAAN